MVGARQFDEDEMLADALEIFWRKGLAGTSMIDLAQATGIQRGSLYNAYGDKEQLFLLAFDRYAERFLDGVLHSLAAPDPRSALEAFFETAIANMTSGSPSRGCLTTKTALDLDTAGAAVEARVKHLIANLTKLLTEALSRPGAKTALSIAPGAAADLIVTFTRGLAVMERIHHDRKHLKQTANHFVQALFQPKRPA
jgi:AcrR family transcriptional regulator